MSGRDVIRKGIKSIEQSQKVKNPDVKKESPSELHQESTVPQENPPIEESSVSAKELSATVQEQSGYVEEPSVSTKDPSLQVGDDDNVVFASDSKSMTEECLEYLKSVLTPITPSVKEEEGEEPRLVQESTVCPHGRIDPLCMFSDY